MLYGRKEPHLIRLNDTYYDEQLMCDKQSSHDGQPIVLTNAAVRTWRVFISNLTLNGYIGIFPAEKAETQKIVVNLSCVYRAITPAVDATVDTVVCYRQLALGIENIVAKGHIPFVESLADAIIDLCFEDARICEVTVRVEKLEAITNAAAVGVELSRSR